MVWLLHVSVFMNGFALVCFINWYIYDHVSMNQLTERVKWPSARFLWARTKRTLVWAWQIRSRLCLRTQIWRQIWPQLVTIGFFLCQNHWWLGNFLDVEMFPVIHQLMLKNNAENFIIVRKLGITSQSWCFWGRQTCAFWLGILGETCFGSPNSPKRQNAKQNVEQKT